MEKSSCIAWVNDFGLHFSCDLMCDCYPQLKVVLTLCEQQRRWCCHVLNVAVLTLLSLPLSEYQPDHSAHLKFIFWRSLSSEQTQSVLQGAQCCCVLITRTYVHVCLDALCRAARGAWLCSWLERPACYLCFLLGFCLVGFIQG